MASSMFPGMHRLSSLPKMLRDTGPQCPRNKGAGKRALLVGMKMELAHGLSVYVYIQGSSWWMDRHSDRQEHGRLIHEKWGGQGQQYQVLPQNFRESQSSKFESGLPDGFREGWDVFI